MKRPILTLFLTVLILLSMGGVVNIVEGASDVTLWQVPEPAVKAAGPFVGGIRSDAHHYPSWHVKQLKPMNLRWCSTSEEVKNMTRPVLMFFMLIGASTVTCNAR